MSQGGNPEWPPKSPHDALLGTPGGRRRLAQRAPLSPSPLRKTKSSASLRSWANKLQESVMDGEDSDDDEETLQLQLQEIQARLKLKKLQKKAMQASESDNESRLGSVPPTIHARINPVAANRAQSRIAGRREERTKLPHENVHVPVSPVRRARPIEEHKSPQRVLLGIDKGLTGRDISLKRAPSLRRREETETHEKLTGPFLQRPVSQFGSRAPSAASTNHDGNRPMSFSERIAAIRTQETDRQERDIRIQKNRSTAFDIDHHQMQGFKNAAVELPSAPRTTTQFSREEILNSSRRSTTPSLRSAGRDNSDRNPSTTNTDRSDSRTSGDIPPSTRPGPKSQVPPLEITETEASQFEPFSATHLSKRIIPHQVLTRTFKGKKMFLIPDILREVKGPDFSGPDIEEDVVVLGIIAQKTDPRSHQATSKADQRGKYMIMGLTDLKWEVDLFLFGTAFDKFWKLPPGTIIAILNPGFMPPPRGKADTGKFSLVLNCDADMILEIGSARDLGFCKSVKKDGKTCDSWVDKRHSEFCDYHVNLTLQKTRSNRMEVNTMNFGKGDYGQKKFNSRDMNGNFDWKKKREKDGKTFYDRESHSNVFIGKRTTANMLDDTDYDPDNFHRGSSKEERLTRQLLSQEKERELERKLGKLGNGLGADYMRAKQSRNESSSHSHPDHDPPPPPPNAKSLGLLGGRATDISLSPIKRKRAHTSSSTIARGWGNDLTKDLERMKEGEKLEPIKKKTRFVTEKGIREAGRESIGGDAAKSAFVDLDDDDSELDIVQ